MQLQMQVATITTIINNIISPFITIAISAVVLRLCRFLCPTELGRLCEQCFFFFLLCTAWLRLVSEPEIRKCLGSVDTDT